MTKAKLKYIYGPVYSWRLGRSLGIDLLAQDRKRCNFDCIYCQIGRQQAIVGRRQEFVPIKKIQAELKTLSKVATDYITLSGKGEPTMASNLGQMIRAIKKIMKEPVAVITNASLLGRRSVRQELMLADLVMVKLDAGREKFFRVMNNPERTIFWKKLLKGIFQFRRKYAGVFALQVMFTAENKSQAKAIANISRKLDAEAIFLNTPLRSCGCRPLGKKDMSRIKAEFAGLPAMTVYERGREKIPALSSADTLSRRGKEK